MAACSFKAIIGGPCSYDCRNQSKWVNEVPLLSCVKDIERHKSLWSFTGVTGEQELIRLRLGIFTTQQDVSELTICLFHRSELGIGWQTSCNTCRVPNEIAHHSQGRGNTKSVKGDRGVFPPCTVCTLDQWKNLIFCMKKGTSCSVFSWNPHPHHHVQMLLRALCVR